jgi:FkbM family methyltransferase
MKISIITPSFNQASFLSRTMYSVACQEYANYEHIIFDGGSKDGSRELLADYASRDKRVSVTSETDRGQAHAINKGLAAATGDILTWLNSDDYYEDSHALSCVVEFLSTHPDVDVCYGRGLRVDAGGHVLSEAFIQPPGSDFSLTLQHSIGLLQPAVFFRRKVYEAVGGLSEKYNLQLDYEFWMRIALHGFRFGRLDRILARAVVHGDAKSTAQRQEQLNECLHLVSDKFGYVPIQWISRYAEFYATGVDRKVIRNIKLSKEQQRRKALVEDVLLRRYDENERALSILQSNQAISPYAETLAAFRRRPEGKRKARQIVITSFDSQYFQQGLNLIASLHRTSFSSVDRILVYALGLSKNEREALNGLEKVEVVDYPQECNDFFAEYLDPKTRAYKPAAIRSGAPHVEHGDLILWMDAGLSALQDIQEIFDTILEKEFFITDHDDRPGWPFFNISFAHPESHAALGITNGELLAPHLCSCLVGYRRGGKFQSLIDQAYEIGKRREAVVWPKVLPRSGKNELGPGSNTGKSAESLRSDLTRGRLSPSDLPREQLLKLFPYYGHRTQTVYSMLAQRYGAPRFSATRYHRSNEQASKAAAVNWQENAQETNRLSSRRNLSEMDSSVVLYHHRGTYDNLDGIRFKRKGAHLFVLGNGPSLKGFELAKLNNYATIGMNAAYRFWETVGFYPTYYCCFDEIVLDSHKEEIVKLINAPENGIQKFFLRQSILASYPELSDNPSVYFLESLRQSVSIFQQNKITTGSFSLLVGLYLGYRNIYFLGIDLDYVEVIPEARQQGRILHIQNDPKNNPNYFFDDYQRKGDRYNPPNRHPGLHERSWGQIRDSLDGFPAKIVNLNSASAVKCFPFGTFDAVIKGLQGEYSAAELEVESELQKEDERQYWRQRLLIDLAAYAKSVGVDETKAISRLFEGGARDTRTMIDVGAHHGGSAAHFVSEGWRILCFEPDSTNREKLTKRFGSTPNVVIDSRAVGEESASKQPFYASQESSGISTLKSFHRTHHQTEVVDVTTVANIVSQYRLDRIDFLKIDVEGLDFSVLRGVPWDTIAPDVIECEFEDAKTTRLGHSYKDMANYLIDKGYTVYISEWHPIVRYGIPHNWCRLIKYPEPLTSPDAWGNLVAFRRDPGLAAFRAALLETARIRRPTPHDAKANPASRARKSKVGSHARKEAAATRYKDLSGRVAKALRARSISLFRFGQFAAFSLRTLWRRRWDWGGLAVLAVLIPLSFAFTTAGATYRWALLGSSLLFAVMLLVTLGVSFTEAMLRRLLRAAKKDAEALVRAKARESKEQFRREAISYDVVSALRAVSPLWTGRSGLTTLNNLNEVEHGHAVLMAMLVDEAMQRPGALEGKTLIEIGSTRERGPAQGSTEKLAIFTGMLGMRFVTVDMDPINTQNAERLLPYLNPGAEAVNRRGEDYLAKFAGSLDYVYLDAFDIEHGKHSPERRARYRTILQTEINNETCWRMHKACAEAIVAKMPKNGIVVIDDTWAVDGKFFGKGRLAVPMLLDHGFQVVALNSRVIALKRIENSAPLQTRGHATIASSLP